MWQECSIYLNASSLRIFVALAVGHNGFLCGQWSLNKRLGNALAAWHFLCLLKKNAYTQRQTERRKQSQRINAVFSVFSVDCSQCLWAWPPHTHTYARAVESWWVSILLINVVIDLTAPATATAVDRGHAHLVVGFCGYPLSGSANYLSSVRIATIQVGHALSWQCIALTIVMGKVFAFAWKMWKIAYFTPFRCHSKALGKLCDKCSLFSQLGRKQSFSWNSI